MPEPQRKPTGMNIRVREPGVKAAFEVKASWAADINPQTLRQLATETCAAIMQRLPE